MTNVRFARIAALGIVLISLFSATPVLAATFTVTKTADTNDGVCGADCSLREAVGAGNALPGADTITLPAGTYTLSIVGTGEDLNATGDLDITGDLTINGAGDTATIIDGGGIDRVLTVFSGATVFIDGVTIQNGNPGVGAGAGGILNAGVFSLTNSTVTDNTGEDFGGGILNTGTLTLTDTTVSDNVLAGTSVSGGGGGIFSSGPLTLTRSTVSGNSTIGRGGGIYGADPTIIITNSTISGNAALNGGGIFNRFGTVRIAHTTITGNTAADNGGGIWNFGGTMTVANSIVSSNTAATPSDDCAGSITSLGHNIASDASCAFAGAGDLNSTDPLLGPLQSNGGETETHALLSGSPAIDAVPLAFCTVATDQRGVPRPQGPGCDIGAFEVEICPLLLTGGIRVTICNSGAIVNSTTAHSSTGGNTAGGSVGGRGGRGGDVDPAGNENNGGASGGNGGNGGNGGTGGLVQTGDATADAGTVNDLNNTNAEVAFDCACGDINSVTIDVVVDNDGANVIDNLTRARARTGQNHADGSTGGNGGVGGDVEGGTGNENNGGASAGTGGAGGAGGLGGTIATGAANSTASTLNLLNTSMLRVRF